MPTFLYLSTCSTCRRILAELGGAERFTLQDLKTDPVSPAQLDRLRDEAGSYEALFNRRSRQYRARGLHERTLSEEDYRGQILAEYTFLKRPILLIGEKAFIGNSKRTVAAAAAALNGG